MQVGEVGEREANYHFHLEHCGWVMGGRRMVARSLSLEEGSCGDFDFAQTEKLARRKGRRGIGKMPKMTVGVEKVSRGSGGCGSFIALFKRRTDADGGGGSTFTRSRERDKAAADSFWPPLALLASSLFVTFLIRFSARRQI